MNDDSFMNMFVVDASTSTSHEHRALGVDD